MTQLIDLHFDKIKPKNYPFMGDHEKLLFQMQVFREFFHRARQNKEHSIKIIHGHGKGKLKDMIYNFLNEQVCISQVRSGLLSEGGDGVTVVYFKI